MAEPLTPPGAGGKIEIPTQVPLVPKTPTTEPTGALGELVQRSSQKTEPVAEGKPQPATTKDRPEDPSLLTRDRPQPSPQAESTAVPDYSDRKWDTSGRDRQHSGDIHTPPGTPPEQYSTFAAAAKAKEDQRPQPAQSSESTATVQYAQGGQSVHNRGGDIHTPPEIHS